MKEWYDLTKTCFQSPSCMSTRNKLNLLRNTKLKCFAFKEHCVLYLMGKNVAELAIRVSLGIMFFPGIFMKHFKQR